jgi:bifunctional UDP-N-acetylglucosamine pyrophosphorylase/glucosamine-1-phosphate N-acetyltransferase
MHHLTKNNAKPMLRIKGRPVLEYKIDALPSEIKEIIFIVGYYREQIMDHFKKNYKGRKITYVIQEKLNGTGGALHLAKSILKDKFLVLNGDDLYHKQDIKKMFKHKLAILACPVEDPSRFGIVKTDRRGNVLEIIEKPKRPKSNLANTGAYVLNKDFFKYDLVSIGNGEFGLPQTLVTMAKDCPIKCEKARIWCPIGKPEDLEKAEKVLHKFGVKIKKDKKEVLKKSNKPRAIRKK